MIDALIVLSILIVGLTIGVFWREKDFRELQARYDRLTDRDARGRFVKREK